MIPYDKDFEKNKTLLVMHSGMGYTFIRNKHGIGTIVGRIANLKNRYVTKYILQYRVNEIAVNYCFFFNI